MLEKRVARGDPTPMLDDMPELYIHLAPVMQAFIYLDRRRQCGMDINPISMESIAAFLHGFGIEDEEIRDLYLTLIPTMDDVLLEHVRKKSKRGANPNPVHAAPHASGVARRRR